MKTLHVPNTDLEVSCIAYGCANIVGWGQSAPMSEEIARADRLIHAALEQGITLFDHADIYAFGKAEAVFGEVLKASPGIREQIVIQSKCGQILPSGDETNEPIRVNLRRKHIVQAAEGSLQRLSTDRLDILLLHAPSALVRPDEVAEAFDELCRTGKVRHFGVSNHSASQIELLKKSIHQPLVVNQLKLGLGNSDLLTDGLEFTLELARADASARYANIAPAGTFDYCRLHGIQIQAWSPLRGGVLKLQGANEEKAGPLMCKLTELAQAKAVTPAALALAWLMHHPAGIVPIIGATTIEHLIDNCAAARIDLTDEEWCDLFAAAEDIASRRLP